MRNWATRAGVLAGTIGLAGIAALAQQPPAPPPAPAAARPQLFAVEAYAGNCAGCHGTTLAGGRVHSVFTEAALGARSDDQLVTLIRNGIPSAGMPAFGDRFDEDQARQIAAYLRIQAGRLRDRPAYVADPNGQIVRSRKQAFRIEVVAPGLDTPWGIAFLPDGRMLVTERAGRLRILDKGGRLLPQPVQGTPATFVRQDGGYFDLALHPDFRRNGWIYMSYTEVRPGVVPAPGSDKAPNIAPPTMTVLIRGRIDRQNRWVDQQTIFRAPPEVYSTTSDHYGSRFLFDRQGHLFYSLGEKHDMAAAQSLASPLGKVHRVRDDGTPLPDNPFARTPGALPTIWSYGHRNPEGLAFDPVTGAMWETEHGPTGGDEVNVIDRGANYGWGVVTMGLEPGLTKRHADGMVDPVAYYTPTIAPSGITFYSGSRYPGWRNSLFVAALAGQQLRRIEVSGRRVVEQEVLFDNLGRVRQVATGPDGLLYVLLQNPTGAGTGLALSAAAAGMVVRLVPVNG